MVERVAKAIYEKFEDRPSYARRQMNGLLAEELARAAIEAMLNAAWRAIVDVKPDDRMAVLLMDTSMAHRVKMLNRWRAMISAALSHPQSPNTADTTSAGEAS
jgi:hypothetical protein